MTAYEYACRLEGLIGACTFPLSADKIPLTGYSWPEIIAKVPVDIRWAGYYDNPIAIVTNRLCCIDFDDHADTNTVPYYQSLCLHKPDALKGLYIERSKNGGIHAVGYQNEYMQAKGKQYNYMTRIDGRRMGVEVKIGVHYFCSYPTPGYMPIGKTLVEMIETGQLSKVSDHWNVDANQEKKTIREQWRRTRRDNEDGDVSGVQDPGYEDFLAEQWSDKYQGSTGRHNGAGMLAKQLYASGCSRTTIKHALDRYWDKMTRKPRRGELEEAVEGASNLAGFEKSPNGWILSRWRYRR